MAFSNPDDAEAENYYYMKRARIRSYFGPYFPSFRLNTDTFQTVYETAGEVSHWKFTSFI